MKIRSIVVIILFSHIIGCSSTQELNLPLHGGVNSTPLYVLTDSSLILNIQPPPDFVPFDVVPNAIYKEQPQYPPLEAIFEKQADVYVKVWINKAGQVVQVAVLRSSDDQFNIAAARAAIRWKFTPAIMKGKPTDVWVAIPFRFRMKRGCAA